MNVKTLMGVMKTLEALKCSTRHSWTSSGRQESVAEHSWRLAMLAYFVKDEFPEADSDKVIMMCLCHDIGEAYKGDIPAFSKTENDKNVERLDYEKFVAALPQPFRNEMSALIKEMWDCETIEAKICRALDKMECLIQHNEANISTWLPLEYELNLTYGSNETEFSEYMKTLKKEINEISKFKINKNQKKG